MRTTLAEWLSYQEQLHPKTIDLGLDRLKRVLAQLEWSRPTCPIVTVGGTNGKGSCVAFLESILSAANYRVGAFTSPHLIRYNERIRIGGREVDDTELVAAFERIENARRDVSLTFFEFNALAAFLIFAAEKLDAIILEVGLGGRLDAVNVIDADVAIVSSIALDHCEWLGHDVESIGREKAGIFRANRPAIFGARAMPVTIASEAQRVGATLLRLGVDFDAMSDGASWKWRGPYTAMEKLPSPALTGAMQFDNAATVLTALDCLKSRMQVDRSAIERGLKNASLPGRFQIIKRRSDWISGSILEWIFDVAHNPAAAATLTDNLAKRDCAGRTIAVCGMFADKDVTGVVAKLKDEIDVWVIAQLTGARALRTAQMSEVIARAGGEVTYIAPDVASACRHAQSIAELQDRIVVFGSFYTVGPALEWIESQMSGQRR